MLTRLQLLGMAREVASGMNYFTEIKFVHRVMYSFFED
jgi:hypothetical protein